LTGFFIPGIAGDAHDIERAYGGLRRRIELDIGRRPSSRRIMSLWSRRGTVDCIAEVGTHDPVRGGTVIAIFDLGARQPFIVWWQQQPGGERACEVLGCSAYSVREFEA
jgi:hypothetical protein